MCSFEPELFPKQLNFNIKQIFGAQLIVPKNKEFLLPSLLYQRSTVYSITVNYAYNDTEQASVFISLQPNTTTSKE